MAIDTQSIIKKYQINDNDSGSTKVQVALLTARIQYLTEHFKTHKKDIHSKRGLLHLVSKRKKLLKYIKNTNAQSYFDLLTSLGLRK